MSIQTSPEVQNEIKTQVLVLGAGPGGYTGAFRAADLGKSCVMVERQWTGEVCLNVGCIPSKAHLHVAKVIEDAAGSDAFGLSFAKPSIDIKKLADWKNALVQRLRKGIEGLAKQRKVQIIQGEGFFESPHSVLVQTAKGQTRIIFEQALIAVGSEPVSLPFLPKDPRIMDSSAALELKDIPERLLVIGGGIIGLEMATVYQALGSRISIVELTETLLMGMDPDIVAPLHKRLQNQYEAIFLKTGVSEVIAKSDGLWVRFKGPNVPEAPQRFDRILVAVGRRSNAPLIQADKAGLSVDERGFIAVDRQQRSAVPHIFAVGDVVGNPMLAHKAVAQAKIAAEVIAGQKHYFEPKGIPSVAYTDPEVASVGLSEAEAKAQGIAYRKAIFPWMANGRSLSLGREEGLTKLIVDAASNRVLGAAIVGPQAGDLIAEVALAIEMGCEAQDLALTIHPHPTLSETVALAAEMIEGSITDLFLPKGPT